MIRLTPHIYIPLRFVMLSRLGLRVHSAARNVAGPLTNQFREYKINADEIKVI